MAAISTKSPDNHFLTSISIDMSSLTYSELLSLSLLSSNDAVSSSSSTTTAAQFSINPSLSTHQQTYSLSPHPRRHRFSLLNQERYESNLIVTFLEKYLQLDDSTLGERPTKKRRENGDGTVEIVNRNGVVVDLAALEERENEGGPYAEELRKRAEGRVEEKELLDMLAAMEGDWCSRRKKRRVVDASLLGDALPVGWKIIVALRRKDGHFFPYCRRYISPTGEQLLSCKEVSSYLQSYFGINDANLVRDSRNEFQQRQNVVSVNHMCINTDDGNSMLNLSNSAIPNNTREPIDHEKAASILGIDNLPDVQVCDLYECHSCNISFDAKDKYMQHVFSLHQKTTKSYTFDSCVGHKVIVKDGKSKCQKRRRRKRLGSSVGDGVIIKDGKYGCQFCHKVFEERRRYLGHVGNHVKGSIKSSKDSLVQVVGHVKAPCMDGSPTAISNSRMEALIEIAQSSIQGMNDPVFEEPASVNEADQLSVAENSRSIDADQKTEKNSCFCTNKVYKKNRCREDKALSADLYPCGMSSACPNETGREKDTGEGKISSKELHPPCNKVNQVSMTDLDVNLLEPSLGEDEREDIGENRSLPEEWNPLGKIQKRPRTDGNSYDPTSSLSKCEVEKDVGEDETLCTELNPLAAISKISMSNGEINGQSFTSNIVDFEKNFCSAVKMTPPDKSYVADNVSGNGRCKSTSAEHKGYADEPIELFNIHNVCCNDSYDKTSDLDSSDKKTQLDYVHKREPLHEHNHEDNEHFAVSGRKHASSCAVPQISLNSSSPFDDILEKAGHNICSLDQNLECLTGLEYMKLDVIEPQMYKYNAMSREDSISFYEVSMDLDNSIGLGLGLENSVKSQTDIPQETAGKCLTTTVCVWCGIEFSHEIVDIDPQPDSVGFMCPACRAKISKQFNELESNFSLSSHCFN